MIKRVSAKRARELRERRRTLEQIADQPGGQVCHRCWQARANDGHELKTRAQGGSITDAANIVPVCRRCHDWVHQHPAAASAQGWLITRKYPRGTP